MLKKKFKQFLKNNKKYFHILNNQSVLKLFFYIYIYTLIYKNLLSLKKIFKQIIFNIFLKKQRYLYYFFRYNLLKFFKSFYHFYNVIGIIFLIKGKYSTFAGGRKKKFSCFFNKNSLTNNKYFNKYIYLNSSTKLGSARFSFFLFYK